MKLEVRWKRCTQLYVYLVRSVEHEHFCKAQVVHNQHIQQVKRTRQINGQNVSFLAQACGFHGPDDLIVMPLYLSLSRARRATSGTSIFLWCKVPILSGPLQISINAAKAATNIVRRSAFSKGVKKWANAPTECTDHSQLECGPGCSASL